jgi:hypothetical protein
VSPIIGLVIIEGKEPRCRRDRGGDVLLEEDPEEDAGEFERGLESDEGALEWLLIGRGVPELSRCERALLSELHKSA